MGSLCSGCPTFAHTASFRASPRARSRHPLGVAQVRSSTAREPLQRRLAHVPLTRQHHASRASSVHTRASRAPPAVRMLLLLRPGHHPARAPFLRALLTPVCHRLLSTPELARVLARLDVHRSGPLRLRQATEPPLHPRLRPCACVLRIRLGPARLRRASCRAPASAPTARLLPRAAAVSCERAWPASRSSPAARAVLARSWSRAVACRRCA
jgi:hypothetical protein